MAKINKLASIVATAARMEKKANRAEDIIDYWLSELQYLKETGDIDLIRAKYDIENEEEFLNSSENQENVPTKFNGEPVRTSNYDWDNLEVMVEPDGLEEKVKELLNNLLEDVKNGKIDKDDIDLEDYLIENTEDYVRKYFKYNIPDNYSNIDNFATKTIKLNKKADIKADKEIYKENVTIAYNALDKAKQSLDNLSSAYPDNERIKKAQEIMKKMINNKEELLRALFFFK